MLRPLRNNRTHGVTESDLSYMKLMIWVVHERFCCVSRVCARTTQPNKIGPTEKWKRTRVCLERFCQAVRTNAEIYRERKTKEKTLHSTHIVMGIADIYSMNMLQLFGSTLSNVYVWMWIAFSSLYFSVCLYLSSVHCWQSCALRFQLLIPSHKEKD